MAALVLTLSLYPDVQRRGQAEIDTIVGRDRLPSFSDLDHLPYLQAVVKELMRCRPIAPLGTP